MWTKLTVIKFTVIGILIAIIAWYGWQNRNLLLEIGEQTEKISGLESQVKNVQAKMDGLADAMKVEREISARREVSREVTRQEIRELRNDIDRLEREIEDVRVWADTDMPIDIYDLLWKDADGHTD